MKTENTKRKESNQPEKETKYSNQIVKLFLFKDGEKKIISMGQAQNMYLNQSKKKLKQPYPSGLIVLITK